MWQSVGKGQEDEVGAWRDKKINPFGKEKYKSIKAFLPGSL